MSPPFPLWRLVARAGPRSAARREIGDPTTFDGDKSPIPKGGDRSPHSKADTFRFSAIPEGCPFVSIRGSILCFKFEARDGRLKPVRGFVQLFDGDV